MSTVSSPLAKAGTSSAPPSISPLRRLWDLLTEPNHQIIELDKRQQARFISGIFFFIAVAVTLLIGNGLLFARTASTLPPALGLFLVIAVTALYFFSRTKYSDLAMTLFVITNVISLFIVYVANPLNPTPFYYIILGVLIS